MSPLRSLTKRLPTTLKRRIWRLIDRLGPRPQRLRSGPAAGLILVAPLRRHHSYGRAGHEPHIMAALSQLVRPGMVALDVGSHLGYFTLALAQLTGPTGRVYAFEPLPAHVTLLQKTLARNHLPQVTLVPQAIGQQTGSATLEAWANASMTRVTNTPTKWGQTYLQVPMTTLDNWAAQTNLSRLDLIKLDIEGQELAALRGAAQTINHFRPSIICELHRGDGVPYQPHEVVDWLASAGYTLTLLPATPQSQLTVAEGVAHLAAIQPAPGWMSVLHLLATPT